MMRSLPEYCSECKCLIRVNEFCVIRERNEATLACHVTLRESVELGVLCMGCAGDGREN